MRVETQRRLFGGAAAAAAAVIVLVAGFSGLPSGYIAERLGLNVHANAAPARESGAPEPATMVLIGSGLFGIGVLRMRQQRPDDTDDDA